VHRSVDCGAHGIRSTESLSGKAWLMPEILVLLYRLDRQGLKARVLAIEKNDLKRFTSQNRDQFIPKMKNQVL
jgi:hypothetical protein